MYEKAVLFFIEEGGKTSGPNEEDLIRGGLYRY